MEASDWSGPVGDAWAGEWRRTDRLFASIDTALLDAALALVPADTALRVLDIGCGAGTTALALAARLPTPRITGIDISPAQIATATARAAEAGLVAATSETARRGDGPEDTPRDPVVAGVNEEDGRARASGGVASREPDVAGVRDVPAGADGWLAFLVADAGRWAGSESFDLLVSRHGLMFFGDPAAALAHIRSLAAPGAPLAFSCFRDPALNPWASEARVLVGGPPRDPDAPGPFAFADRDRTAGLLALAGFADARAEPLDFTFVAGAGDDPVADAVDFFTRVGPAAEALRTAAVPDRARITDGLAAIVDRHRAGDRVVFPGAAWIWTARA